MPDDISGMAEASSFVKNSSQLSCSFLPTPFLVENYIQKVRDSWIKPKVKPFTNTVYLSMLLLSQI